jgi:hypothetical protein
VGDGWVSQAVRPDHGGQGCPGTGGGNKQPSRGGLREQPERAWGSTAGTTATATSNGGSTEGPGGAGRGDGQVREHAHKDSGSHPHCQLDARYVGHGSPHPVHLRGERFVQPPTGTHGAQPGARASLRTRDPTVIRFASERVSERDRTPGRPPPYRSVRGRRPPGALSACQGLWRFEHFPHGLGSAE